MTSAHTNQPINDTCPWSGEPVSDDAVTTYKGEVVAFCNPGCRDKFDRAIQCFDQKIDQKKESHS